jgi:hypothetical protein
VLPDQDGGDPAVEASPRDIVYTLPAAEAASNPSAEPRQLAQTDLRCGGVAWGDDTLALLYESWYKTRRSVIWAFAPGEPDQARRVLFDRNYEDAYTDPGSPASRRTARGTYVLARLEGTGQLLMQGACAAGPALLMHGRMHQQSPHRSCRVRDCWASLLMHAGMWQQCRVRGHPASVLMHATMHQQCGLAGDACSRGMLALAYVMEAD